MLICKNCGETAPDGTLTCPACRMAGRFRTLPVPAAPEAPAPDAQPPTRHCRNCASPLPPRAEKCPQCQMPLRMGSSGAHTSSAVRFDLAHFLN
ncbi:MAG TPA: hypothetical protein PK971_07650 [Saprospiraceae bacterium]|nr:hypothetical protein [Saprospiraceae bacterium]